MLYVDVNAMDVETEADSNDVTECPHDDQQSSGMFGFFDCRFSTFNEKQHTDMNAHFQLPCKDCQSHYTGGLA